MNAKIEELQAQVDIKKAQGFVRRSVGKIVRIFSAGLFGSSLQKTEHRLKQFRHAYASDYAEYEGLLMLQRETRVTITEAEESTQEVAATTAPTEVP